MFVIAVIEDNKLDVLKVASVKEKLMEFDFSVINKNWVNVKPSLEHIHCANYSGATGFGKSYYYIINTELKGLNTSLELLREKNPDIDKLISKINREENLKKLCED